MSRHHHHHHRRNEINERCTTGRNFERLVQNARRTEEIRPEAVEEAELHFTEEEALLIARHLGIDFESCGYDVEEFRRGLDVELEHGRVNRHTNITNNDPILTGKITLAHLNEFPDYYQRLTRMEEEATHYWKKQRDRD